MQVISDGATITVQGYVAIKVVRLDQLKERALFSEMAILWLKTKTQCAGKDLTTSQQGSGWMVRFNLGVCCCCKTPVLVQAI